MTITAIPTRQRAAALREGEEASGSEFIALAASRDARIRESLASRQDAPVSVLIHLALDPKSHVRKALASNPAVGVVTSVVGILAADADPDVVLALVANAATPDATLRDLLHHPRRNVCDAARARLLVA